MRWIKFGGDCKELDGRCVGENMLHLYEVTVSTNMLVVSNSRDEAISTAKIYAVDEISEFCDVKLKEIHDEKSMSDEWKHLYPYIANKCIDQQKKCCDLIKDIQKIKSDISRENTENTENTLQPPSRLMREIDNGSLRINSPAKKDLPTLRF